MASGTILTLLGVCLLFLASANAQVSVSYSNISVVGGTTVVSLSFENFALAEHDFTLAVGPASVATGVVGQLTQRAFNTENATLNYTLTGHAVGVATLSWTSATDNTSAPANSSIFVFGNIAPSTPSYIKNVGVAFNLTFQLTSAPPTTGIIVTPLAPEFTFTPNSFPLVSATKSQTVTIYSATAGTATVEFVIGGADALFYNPYNFSVTLDQAGISFAITPAQNPLVPGTLYHAVGTLTLPVINDLTVTLQPPAGVTLSTTSFALQRGASSFQFDLQVSQIGTFQVQVEYSGTDQLLYQTPAPFTVTSTLITINTPAGPATAIINVPFTFEVSLQTDTTQTVVVSPFNPNLNITPAQVTLGNGVLKACFVAVPLRPANASVITFAPPVNQLFATPANISVPAVGLASVTFANAPGVLEYGVQSSAILVTINYNPLNPFTLTPSVNPTSSLIITPSVLNFGPGITSASYTIEAPGPATPPLPSASITWTLAGLDAQNVNPVGPQIILLKSRTIYIPSPLPARPVATVVNAVSAPLVIYVDVPTTTGTLTLTPTAPDLTFSPSVVNLTGVASASFTAVLGQWTPGNAGQYQITYVVAGSASSSYVLSSTVTYLTVSQRTIATTVGATTLIPGIASSLKTLALSAPTEASFSLTVCAPFTTIPSPLVVPAGAQYVSYQLIAPSGLPSGTYQASWEFVNAGADFYTLPTPGTFPVTVANTPSFSVSPIQTPIEADTYASFTISLPNVGGSLLDAVTVTFAATYLVFTPSSVTFSDTVTYYQIQVATLPALPFANQVTSLADTVTFVVSGPNSAAYAPLSAVPVQVNQHIPAVSTILVNGITTLSIRWPVAPTSPLTVTALPSNNVVVTPPSVTLTSTADAFFVITPSTTAGYVAFSLSGATASNYEAPALHTVGAIAASTVSFLSSSLDIFPGNSQFDAVILSSPAVNGLTVTLVVPPGLTATPSVLNFLPGASSLPFSLTVTPTTHNGQYSVLALISGPDQDLFALNTEATPLSVSIDNNGQTVSISLPTFEVGVPQWVQVVNSLASLNGYTLSFQGNGVTFNPQNVTVGPNVFATGVQVTTTVVAQKVPVYVTLSGPDSWFFTISPGAANLVSNARVVVVDLPSPISTTAASLGVVLLDVPPPTLLSVALSHPCFTFTPAVVSFTSSSAVSAEVSVAASGQCATSNGGLGFFVNAVLGGTDAAWYQLDTDDSNLEIQVQVPEVFLNSGGYTVYSGVVSSPQTIYLAAPANVNIALFAAGCTFSPQTLSFNYSQTTGTFTTVCTTTGGDSVDAQVPTTLYYALSGPDANWFDALDTWNIWITPNVLTIPPGPVIIGGANYPSALSYAITSPPVQPVTLQFYSSLVTFSPSSVTFGPTSAPYATVYATPSGPNWGNLNPGDNIQYSLSGPGAQYVTLTNPSTSLNFVLGNIYASSDFIDVAVGTKGQLVTVTVQPPVINPAGLVLTPSAPGCSFEPSALSFGPTTPALNFVVQNCAFVGEFSINFLASGSSALYYDLLEIDLEVDLRNIVVSYPSTSVVVASPFTGYFTLDTPVTTSLTLTPATYGFSLVGATSITIPAGGQFAQYTLVSSVVTSNDVQQFAVSWTLSGPDAAYYTVASNPSVAVSQGTITINQGLSTLNYLPNDATVPSGVVSNSYQVILNPPAQQGLTLSITGVVATPPSLVFGPGASTASFTVNPLGAGQITVVYIPSGPDAGLYFQPSPQTLTIELLTPQITVPDTVIVGVPTFGVLSVVSDTSAVSPTASATFALSGDGISFSPASVTVGPRSASAAFSLTATQVSPQATITAVITSGDLSFFTTEVYDAQFVANARTIYVPSPFPDLYAGVASTQLSVSVAYPPPTGFTLTPSSGNAVFNPPQLSFGPNTYTVNFTVTATLPAAQNVGTDSSTTQQVLWSLTGPDAGLYSAPPQSSFAPLPRDLIVISTALGYSAYVNVPFSFYVTTTYPSTNGLTITPSGPFTFSPSSVTLAQGQTSVSFTATASASGNFPISFSVTGADAPLYEWLPPVSVTIDLWQFEFSGPNTPILYNALNAPISVTSVFPPPNSVTLTPVNEYLSFYPASITLTHASPSASYTFSLNGLSYQRQSNYDITFFVSGPDAALYAEAPVLSFNSGLTSSAPIFQLSVSNTPGEIEAAVPSAPFTITLPYPPVHPLTITPFSNAPDAVFNPAFVTVPVNPSTLTAAFTVTVQHPRDTSLEVNFIVTGADAYAYGSISGFSVSVYPRSITLPSSPPNNNWESQTLTVGVPSPPAALKIHLPTPNSVTVTFSSPGAVFNPTSATFTPSITSVPISVTGLYPTTVPVFVWITGPDADLYEVPNSFSLNFAAKSFYSQPEGNIDAYVGQPIVLQYVLSDPPAVNSSITLTPSAAGITFTPAQLTIAYPFTSGTIVAVGNEASILTNVFTTITGPDAASYPQLNDYQIRIGFAPVSVVYVDAGEGVDLDGDQIEVNVGDITSLVFDASTPAINGFTIFPQAAGLTFTPPQVYFAPGVRYAHVTFRATGVPGTTNIYYTLAGPDAGIFTIAASAYTPVYVDALNLVPTSLPSQPTVGSWSGAFAFTSQTSDGLTVYAPPGAGVNLTFVVSPASAADISPAYVTLDSTSYTAHFRVRPNIIGNVVVQPVLSGPGAAYYNPLDPVVIQSQSRTFTVNDPVNFLFGETNGYDLLVVGVESPQFAVYTNAVPDTDVALTLSAPGLQFTPSVLLFTGTYETLYFTITPTVAIQTQVTFSVTGTNAGWYEVPDPSNWIRVTHQFNFPAIPPVTVGTISDPITLSITDTLSNPVIITPFSQTGCAVFQPPTLIFTPVVSTQTFSIFGRCVDANVEQVNYNPVLLNTAFGPNGGDGIQWQVLEAGESATYSLPPNSLVPGSAAGVTIVPAVFYVSFSSIFIGRVGTVNISVSVPPRSDVLLTLIANNLNFEPPFAAFTSNTLYQVLNVTTIHNDFVSSNNIPFTVDYIVSGTNYVDFLVPAQTYLGVRQGSGGQVQAGSANAVAVHGGVVVLFISALLLLM